MGNTGKSANRLSWLKLLSEDRLENPQPADPVPDLDLLIPTRTETERDFDRILYATPTRRLGDKTQVFPLDKNESVRTRLTHSHEVSNLARSIGTYIVNSSLGDKIISEARSESSTADVAKIRRAIPAMLAAAGLAHDLGNPPFGHQGEVAIQSWVREKRRDLFSTPDKQHNPYGSGDLSALEADIGRLNQQHRADFLNFEGNAQTIRTVSRLQIVKDSRGLNLTFGTLAALMKYTVDSDHIEADDKAPAAAKKNGYFASENPLAQCIHEATGTGMGVRHPLTYLMEACDDMAYSVIDAEDAIKKRIVSFADIVQSLKNTELYGKPGGEVLTWIVDRSEAESNAARRSGLSPAELSDVSVQMFRAYAINAMASAVIHTFEDKYDAIMQGTFVAPLISASAAQPFCKAMKKFDREHAYQHRGVLQIELTGFNTIHGLMDMLWIGITDRESFLDVASKRRSAFSRYAYGRISENYRRIFEGKIKAAPKMGIDLPVRYRELQLLTDMVSGMTDQYAIDLYQELNSFYVGASKRQI